MAERVTWVVDRIEGDCAVVEIGVGHTVELPLSWLPPGAGEGAHLRVSHEPMPNASRLVLQVEPRASLSPSAKREPPVKPGRGDPGGNFSL